MQAAAGAKVQPIDTTSALPPDYERARARLFSLRRPTDEALDYAWRWLRRWFATLDAEGISLPAPYVFSNEQGSVELEWETPRRFLMLRLVHTGPFEFFRTEEQTGYEDEGPVNIDGVCPLLRWLLSE